MSNAPFIHVTAMSTITEAPFGLPVELQYHAVIAVPAKFRRAITAYLWWNRSYSQNTQSDEINMLLTLPGSFIVKG